MTRSEGEKLTTVWRLATDLGRGACYHFQTNLPSVCAIITPVWRQETLETEERRGEAAAGHH